MKSSSHLVNPCWFGLSAVTIAIATLLAVPVTRSVHGAAALQPSCVMNPVVTNTSDFGPGSLRDAIESACDGSIIKFANTVTGTITVFEPLEIDANLTILGPGANLLSISGNNSTRVFLIGVHNPTIGVELAGLTITNGRVSGRSARSGSRSFRRT
jgi:hypothetical protein